MPWSFGRNHRNIHSFWRLDRAKPDVETVREHERLARFEIRLDGVAIKFRLLRVWGKNHDDVGPGRGFRRRGNGESFFLSFGARRAGFQETNSDLHSAVPQV